MNAVGRRRHASSRPGPEPVNTARSPSPGRAQSTPAERTRKQTAVLAAIGMNRPTRLSTLDW